MKNKQKGFSLLELLIVVAIILLIAAFAIPNLMRTKMATNEASAVASLHTLNTVIVEYSTNYNTVPSNLSSLKPATAPSSAAAGLVDGLLSSDPAAKNGYSIAYKAGSGTPISSYTMVATPWSALTGQRKFYTDQSGVIRQTTDGSTPNSSSTPIS